MRSSFKISIISVLLFSAGSALASTPLPFVLHCPSTSFIKVNFSNNTATAPGGWQGSINNMSEKDWPKNIYEIDYNAGGYCQYMSMNGELDLTDKFFPANYNLYDFNQGTNKLTECDDNPTIDPDGNPCYYYPNSY